MMELQDDAYFRATHQGAEIDAILRRGDRLLGVECKRIDAPHLTPSIRIAVIYPDNKRFPLSDNVEAIHLEELGQGHQQFE